MRVFNAGAGEATGEGALLTLDRRFLKSEGENQRLTNLSIGRERLVGCKGNNFQFLILLPSSKFKSGCQCAQALLSFAFFDRLLVGEKDFWHPDR